MGRRVSSNNENYKELDGPSNDDLLSAMGPRKSRKNVNYKELEGPSDDDLLWCQVCREEYDEEKCPKCGPMKFIENTEVEKGDPQRARKTLPPCLYIAKSSRHGLGVFAKVRLKSGIYFGPYEGIRREVGDKDLDPRYSFKIEEDGKVAYYIDGKDEATSNWMRYVNCPKNSDEENLKTWPYKKSIYYITNSTIEPDTELLVWCGGEYAKDHGVLPPEPDCRKISRKRAKKRRSDSSYKSKRKIPKHSSQAAAELNCTEKGWTEAKGPKIQAVDSEEKLPENDESDDNTTTNEDCIEKSNGNGLTVSTDAHDSTDTHDSTDVHDSTDARGSTDGHDSTDAHKSTDAHRSTDAHKLENESNNKTSNDVPSSDCFVQSDTDSPGLPDISEVTDVECSLPEPRSSSTSTLSETDIICISDEESDSNDRSKDKEGSSKPILPLKPRISNWNSSGEHTATKVSQKMTQSKPNIVTGKDGAGVKIEQSTETKENERNFQETAEYRREMTFLQKDLQIKKLEIEETELKLTGKCTEKKLIQLEARIAEINEKILGNQSEIQQLDEGMTSLQTMLKKMKNPDVIIIDTHNGPSKDTEQEIKHLNQVIITKQQELDIKKLEKTETEMKIQKKFLERDKDYLHSELNKLSLKLGTLKSKKKDIEEQIREVQRSLLQTYYSGISSN